MVLVASFLLLGNAFAQEDYTWDHHGIGFSAPSNFVTETNNSSEFSADNGSVFLYLLPWQDASINDDNLADATIEVALEMEYDQLTDADELSIQDFEGYYVEGEKDGMNAFVACLLDTESPTNVIVVILYSDGHVDDAAGILTSLYAYDWSRETVWKCD